MLANKLGTTGTHLWEVLLRQAPISSISSIILFLSCCIINAIFWKITAIFSKKHDEEENMHERDKYNEAFLGAYIVSAIFSFILLLILCFNCDVWISGLFNPEYWALQHIIETFK